MAERILLDQAATEDAMEMYQELHQFEDAVRIAAQKGMENLDEMRESYFQYLLQSHQVPLVAMLFFEKRFAATNGMRAGRRTVPLS